MHEFFDVDGLAAPDAVDQAEIGGGEQADVVGVLPVDALEAFGDDQADAGQLLGDRAVFARGALAVAGTGDGDAEAPCPHLADADRRDVTDLHAGVDVFGQPLVEEHQGWQRGDFVG